MAAQPQRAATADGGKGNVDAEARTKQGRWSPLSACSRGFCGLAISGAPERLKKDHGLKLSFFILELV